MSNIFNLLINYKSPLYEAIHKWINIALIVLMFLSALIAIILVLLQPSNSSGIDALGGSSETFFGKNKGKSIEAKMKKWTIVCLVVLIVCAITFYILSLPAIWAYKGQ